MDCFDSNIVSQSTLISRTPHPMWTTMSTLGHKNSNHFCIGGELVVVGRDKNGKVMSDIHHYLPETNEFGVLEPSGKSDN